MSKQQQQSQGPDMATSMMKNMSVMMPLMSMFICVSLPAAIGIYWSISALITMLTQLIINWYYDHSDMDKILEKQMEKARIKKEKKGDKKSFYKTQCFIKQKHNSYCLLDTVLTLLRY